METKNFETGNLLATAQINNEMKKNGKFAVFCQNSLNKHKNCDWGDLCDGDKEENNLSLENNNRLFSSYNIPKDINVDNEKKIWIITECDRSVTTILFPSEY